MYNVEDKKEKERFR